MTHDMYGPQTYQIEKLIEKINLLTPKQIQNLGAAWGAARGAARGVAWDAARGAARGAGRVAAWDAAWDAAWVAARDAAWDETWGATWGALRDAVLGLVSRDLIGEKFTQAHYDLLTKPWRDVIGEFEEPSVDVVTSDANLEAKIDKLIVMMERIYK